MKLFLFVIIMGLFLAISSDQMLLNVPKHMYQDYANKFDTCVTDEEQEESECYEFAYNAIWWIEMYTRYNDLRNDMPHTNLLESFEAEELKWSI